MHKKSMIDIQMEVYQRKMHKKKFREWEDCKDSLQVVMVQPESQKQ